MVHNLEPHFCSAMTGLQDVHRFGILSGIRRGMDWRPTEFVDEVPPQWVCSLCGRITMRTAALPCSHRLCQFCLQGCRTASTAKDSHSFSCVLDGAPVPHGEPLVENHCDVKDIFAFKVKCWNSQYGCSFVGPLADLLDHFEQHCAFHAVTCRRCHAPVLMARLSAHYISGCGDRSENQAEARKRINNASSNRGEELVHDTLASLESRMNELVECVKGLDSKSSFLVSSFDEARELLKVLASAGSGAGVPSHTSSMDDSVQERSNSGSHVAFLQTPNEIGSGEQHLHDARRAFRHSSHGTSGSSEDRFFGLGPEGGPERLQSMPSGTEPTQLTRFLSEDGGEMERERRALLVAFKRTKPNTSSSASDFLPLYDLLKRGIELSIPETWTAKLELDNESCHVKLVILEENSALDFYGRVEERRRTFNPWKIESVRLAHPSEWSVLPTESMTCVEPTWTHSRSARLKLQGSGYCHYGSNRFEAMCRRGFVVGDDTVKFRVTLVRKWNAPPTPSGRRAQSLTLGTDVE